jgi:DNA-binding transcriptional regulator WhiA
MSLIKINESLSELYGALIGDGCLSSYPVKDRKNNREVVLFTGHLDHDFDYYQNVLYPIIKKEFRINGYLQKRKSFNCIRYVIFSKEVFKFFIDLGFPLGKKIKLEIPQGILKNNENALACLRGIFNTDGSIYQRYSKKYSSHPRFYNYAVIQIKMNSERIIKQIKEILNKNYIKTTKIGRDKKAFILRVTDQKEIKKFIEIINPTNKYHIERYLNIINQTS